MGSVSWRKRGDRYLVSWRLDDGSQGGKTVDTPDEARDLAAEKRLEMRRGTWRERRSGRRSFSQWVDDWWEVWAADPDRSPTTLAAPENRLRRHVAPWFGDRPIKRIGPADIRRWQAQLAGMVGRESLLACRSILHRILQFAEDEGAIASNPVRKVPPPKRRADPEQLLGEAKRRAYTPEEAGRLLGRIPLSWWDHVLVFLALACGSVSWPACAAAGSISIGPCPSSRSSRCATRPAASSVAASKAAPRATPASGSYRSPRCWSSPSAGSSHPTPTRRSSSSPAPAAQWCPRWLADDAVAVQLPPHLPAHGRSRWP
jgi:hypothetical protein